MKATLTSKKAGDLMLLLHLANVGAYHESQTAGYDVTEATEGVLRLYTEILLKGIIDNAKGISIALPNLTPETEHFDKILNGIYQQGREGKHEDTT